jgi:isoquinoline 1-oxidoreductase beta subunit
VHQQFLGGGYGRRIWPDAAIQATIISNITKKPVKLILTREEDIAAARPRPMTHHPDEGRHRRTRQCPSAGIHRLVSENVDAGRSTAALQGHRRQGLHRRARPRSGLLRHSERTREYVREDRGMRVHAWRGIGSGYNKFAAEAFLDEVAQAAGKDPLALRLELTKKQAARQCRHQGGGRDVGLQTQAPRPRHGHRVCRLSRQSVGRAWRRYRSTRRPGKITVHNYWVVADPGLVIQPDHVHAQLESAVVYGLSAALIEQSRSRTAPCRPRTSTAIPFCA